MLHTCTYIGTAFVTQDTGDIFNFILFYFLN